MPKEEVIELSVDETNELRKKLGLAPLRINSADKSAPSSSPAAPDKNSEEVLELSVVETNNLRAKLGLPPLRTSLVTADGSSSQSAVHQPAPNTGQERELKERLEKARLERQVQQGIQKLAATRDDDEQDETPQDAQSWAARMRSKKTPTAAPTRPARKTRETKKAQKAEYDEQDLEGLAVSHNVSELQAGSTTVLTLQDAPLLRTKTDTTGKVTTLDEDGQDALENVDLTSQQREKDRLHQKRQVELGMGRAGGYAGFDDDEFVELGGTQGPSRVARGMALQGPPDKGGEPKKRIGFQIGQAIEDQEADGNDLFAAQEGRAISLESGKGDVTASDFMTAEEYEAEVGPSKKSKESKFKKKKRRKDKKNRRKEIDEEEEEEASGNQASPAKGLLEELEETAVEVKPRGRKRRSRATSDDADGTQENDGSAPDSSIADKDEEAKKRAKFDAIMAKGNARTASAFQSVESNKIVLEDEEPDDAFLNAALAKARRLRRLKELSQPQARGADAVTQALQEANPTNGHGEKTDDLDGGDKAGVTFSSDDTREFTRALRARAEQTERQASRKTAARVDAVAKRADKAVENVDEAEDDDMEELAKEVADEDEQDLAGGLEGTTASQVTVGRGMAGVLSMLKQTGEISGKNSGREELRGRAKDKRTYEDYEALDLKNVVKIDERNATDKDKEFANREVKLEYRDDHGRLLTRKEAYRNLCYQFHGHGSSKKNEERRLRQIQREQAAARLASRQVHDDGGKTAGSLGALKATQKATGKAFVVHKTT